MDVNLLRICHPIYGLLMVIQVGNTIIQGVNACETDKDCFGYICGSNKCICDSLTASCEPVRPKAFSERCLGDHECSRTDPYLYCNSNDAHSSTCKCRKPFNWDGSAKRCIRDIEMDSYDKFDPIQNLVIPIIIVITILAMIYLGIKLFCNCGKLWRRRRSQLTRELEGMAAAAASSPHQPATWVASYRVFSPLSNPNHHGMHPAPCLFLPGHGSIPMSPPSYEEALKHKVILSSYHPSGYPTSPAALPLYSISAPEVLPENPSVLVPNRHLVATRPTIEIQRPPRYYGGDETGWTGNGDMPAESQRGNYSFATIRGSGRNMRIAASHRLHPVDVPRRETIEQIDQVP